MRLIELRLVNFRQHVDTTLTFESGLTGIIGANGSGKSTLLEAIAWALYGTPAARGSREGIRSLRAGTRAPVRAELEFELGGHRYRVVRSLTGAELYLDGATAPIANSITGVSELLRRRLGMTLDEFFNTYFTGQKELAVMAAMGPTERGQFLSRVLGYERLRAAQGLIRDQRKVLIAEATGLRQGMADAEVVAAGLRDAGERVQRTEQRATVAASTRATVRARLDLLLPEWEAAQRQRELLQSIRGELGVAEANQAALARELSRVARDRDEVAGARDELDRLRIDLVPLPALRVQLADFERLAREEGRRQTLVDEEQALGKELARLHERRAQLESAPALEVELKAELTRRREELNQADVALERARTDWVRDKQEAETKIEQLKQTLLELREQRDRLIEVGEDGTCPTCSRPLGDHYRAVLDLIDEQLDAVTVDGRYFRARIEQLTPTPPEVEQLDATRREVYDAVAKLDRKCARVQSAVHELAALTPDLSAKERRHAEIRAEIAALPVGYDAGRHESLRTDVQRLIPIEALTQRLSAIVDRDGVLAAEAARTSVQLTDAQAKIAALIERRNELVGAERQFDALRATFDDATATFRAAEMELISADADRVAAVAAFESAQRASAELARAQAQLDALGHARHMHEELDRAYGDMRGELNLQLRPEIAEIASRYLTELTDGRYTELELDDAYNIIVLEDGIPKPVISGGEEDVANLVLRLAISQMIADRAGQPFSLLVLDEVFGSLDESRRHNVIELLRRLHDRFEQVIVITHIEAVREGLDRVVTVRYDEESGSSRVEQDPIALPTFDEIRAGAA